MKVGLICEGGGTKTAYTSGALKALLDHDVIVPYAVGISAGAENLLPYVSRQPERLKITGVDATCNPNAIGIKPIIKEHGIFGIEETCAFLEEKAPLDFDTFYSSSTQLDIGIYNIKTGEVEYYPKSELDKNQTLLKASCALCLLSKPYHFKNSIYMDAGLVDMISIEQSKRAGCDKHIFISTKEPNYKRKPAPSYQVKLAKLLYRKYPNVARDLAIRHENYEKQWAEVDRLERAGKALVLRPSADYGISRYTHDKEKLEPWYNLGYEDTVKRIAEIKAFMKE